MQDNATSAGLPLPQPGRPFYFVEVSQVPVKSASPLHALPPRAMYTRTSQVRTGQPLPTVCTSLSEILGLLSCPVAGDDSQVCLIRSDLAYSCRSDFAHP